MPLCWKTGWIVSCLAFLSAISRAGDPAASSKKKDQPPRIALVTYLSPAAEANSLVLGAIQIKRAGKREFMVGKIVFVGEQAELEKKTAWIPVDRIVRLIEFESEEQAIRTCKKESEPIIEAPDTLEAELKLPAKIHWRKSYSEARKEAGARSRLLLVFFLRSDNPWCEQLLQMVSDDKRLTELLHREVIALAVNGAKDRELTLALAVDVFPTMLLADSTGKILSTIRGCPESSDRLVMMLRKGIDAHTAASKADAK